MAIAKAVGNKAGLRRYGHAYVPLDEALSRVVVDFSGRPGLEYHIPFTRARIGDFDVDLTREFFQGLVNHALITLHIDNLRGVNAHHQCETVFKACGRACAWPSRSTRAWATSCRPPRACCNVHDLPHRIRQTELTTIAIVDYGMGNFHSVARALRYAAPTPTSASATSPMRSTRPTGSCSPARAPWPIACAR